MRVLITATAGNLDAGMAPLLGGTAGFRRSDVVPVAFVHKSIRADVGRLSDLIVASAGVDVILHTGAWHGIQMRSRAEPHSGS